jgi:hypothetical protein
MGRFGLIEMIYFNFLFLRVYRPDKLYSYFLPFQYFLSRCSRSGLLRKSVVGDKMLKELYIGLKDSLYWPGPATRFRPV